MALHASRLRPASSLTPLKLLNVKHNALKRLSKELSIHNEEAKSTMEKIHDLTATGSTEDEMKRYTELYKESMQVIPEVERRVVSAYNDLNEHVKQHYQVEASRFNRGGEAVGDAGSSADNAEDIGTTSLFGLLKDIFSTVSQLQRDLPRLELKFSAFEEEDGNLEDEGKLEDEEI